MLKLHFKQQLGQFLLDIDTIIPAKGITAILGLSGAGKTSLINVISGLTHPDFGQVILNNQVLVNIEKGIFLSPQKRRIGYVFQDARLFPHYTVKGNLTYGMLASMKPKFETIIELLGIRHLLKRYPYTLSGGEKQRVAIGRALLTDPCLLLMDEPLAALDLPRKQELIFYLQQLSNQVNIPILYISHSLDEIIQLADTLLLLEQGKVTISESLENVWASGLLQPWLKNELPSALLRVPLVEHHADYAMSAILLAGKRIWLEQLSGLPGEQYRIKISADDISLTTDIQQNSSQLNHIPVIIQSLHSVGKSGFIDVKLQTKEQITLWSRISPWAKDQLQLIPNQKIVAMIQRINVINNNISKLYR